MLNGSQNLSGEGTFQTNWPNITGVSDSYSYTGSTISITPSLQAPTILGKLFTVIDIESWTYVIERQSNGTWGISEVQSGGNYRVRYSKAGATDLIKTFTVGTNYELSFNQNGGIGTAEAMTVFQGGEIGTLPALIREGYTFDSWTIDDTPITSTTVWNYTDNKTAVAKWTLNRYTVSFETNGGSVVNAQTVDYNTAITKPSDPTKTGYTFGGWYTDEALQTSYVFTSSVTDSFTLYAKWTANDYTLSFDKNSGTGTATAVAVTYDAQIGTLPTLTREGYTFDGWTIDGSKITNTTVWNYTENKTAVASWTIIALPAPTMTNGAGQTITRGQGAKFTSSGDFGGYVDTLVTLNNGTKQTVHTAGNDNANARAVNGSIIVTLSGTYTATLPVGTHSISINSAGGSATTTFTVVAPAPTPTPSNPAISPLTGVDGHTNPQTGDNSNTPLFITLILVSALGLTALFFTRKKYLAIRKK